jgi:hypothetical protein
MYVFEENKINLMAEHMILQETDFGYNTITT